MSSTSPFDPDTPLADTEEALHELARTSAGLENFGEPDYLEGLRVLLRSCDEDADLSPSGRRMAAGLVLTALTGRLHAEAGFRAHPEHRDVRIERPIVIVGLPRTGTTALHRMLCEIDGHQGLELWLAQSPQPRPPRHGWDDDPAYQRSVALTAAADRAAPEMAAIHEMRADAPDECWNLLRQSFTSVTFECVLSVTAFARWWADCDMTAAYQRWADCLRLIGLDAPDDRWVLKDPSHLFAPEALLAAVPDATIVMTHRDPAKSIPSVCSLNAAARHANDRVPDPARLGREQLALWRRGLSRIAAARDREPERFVDVHFHDLVADPFGTIRHILDHSGQVLDAEGEKAVEQWLASHPRESHRYGAKDFGLRDDAIRDTCADYIERFGVRLETGGPPV